MLLIQNQDEMQALVSASAVQSSKRVFGSLIVERKHCQCYPLLPYSGSELCIQGLLQEAFQL
ncbi:unnamed protein product [Rhodiola kirilowii]